LTTVKKQRLDLFSETLRLAFVQQGAGRPLLILHGGDGPGSMMGLADALATRSCTVLPTHPGFDGEPRPERFTRVDDVVLAYLALLERLDVRNVVVVGNSFGGWLAAELALRKSPRIAGAVLINAVGVDGTIADAPPAKLPPDELLARAFHDPKKFATFLTPPSPEAAATRAENVRSLLVYAGDPYMHDPGLRARLAAMTTPTLVAWGESDRLIDLDYGRSYAASIPGARFEVIPKAGHLPHIERLEDTHRVVEQFAAKL
jgi:pimeloyl-ACP methyl ester carboxylesterase